MLLLSPSVAILDVGGTELLMIMLVTLLLFGSKRLPELARGLGKAMRDFRKAASGLEEELKRAMETPSPPQPRQPLDPPRADLSIPGPAQPSPPAAPSLDPSPPASSSPPPEEHHFP
jgi:TatA/E family protein of Tat protein translocase